MAWTLSPFTIVVVGGAVVATLVGVTAVRQRPDPMAWPLAVAMFAVAAWAIPHAVSFGFTSPARVAFWTRLQYPGTVLAPVAYLVVALRYAGYGRWLSRRTYGLLAVVPALTLVVVWTNPSHGLLWHSYSVARVYGATILVPEYGPWYWLNLGYLYLVTVTALLTFGTVVLRRGQVYRKQATVMFLGGFVPLLANVAVNSGVGPDPMIDFTTTGLALSGLTFALALFRLDLLDIRPVARDRLLAQLEDGVIIVGPEGRIREFNRTAERIFGDLAPNQPAAEVLPSRVVPDGGELVVEIGDDERHYRTRATPLTDQSGRDIGRIVYLNDVTEVVKREQRISVLSRILRHNIRNELNVTVGHLELLEPRVTAEHRDHVQAAMESTRRVVDAAEKARHVERTLETADSSQTVSAATVVEDVVTDADATVPDSAIEYERPRGDESEASVRVPDEQLFRRSIEELLENAVAHTDRAVPQVTVTVEPGPDRVRVSVADNGPGIPEQEVDVLSSSIETHLDHSSGLGLWLVKWTASVSAGSLSFTENDPRGTVVTLTLPAAE